MHKIDKFLGQLDKKRREKILAVFLKIRSGDLKNLDIKKLKGQTLYYRVRIGDVRIIYSIENNIQIIAIERRNETTYRK